MRVPTGCRGSLNRTSSVKARTETQRSPRKFQPRSLEILKGFETFMRFGIILRQFNLD